MSAHVNRPTNVRRRDEDIDRKLQLYGIASAFQNGKLPSNEQIDATLNSFIASEALSSPSNKLSNEGRALVADFRDVVNEAKRLLLSKNQGDLLQNFIWKTSRFDYGGVSGPGAPVSENAARQDRERALEGLKTLGRLLITNGQFRKLRKAAPLLHFEGSIWAVPLPVLCRPLTAQIPFYSQGLVCAFPGYPCRLRIQGYI